MAAHTTGHEVMTMSRKSIALGFFAGALAGSAIALLMAPDNGAATRQRIASKARDLSGKGQDFLRHTGDNVRTVAGDLASKARSGYDRVVHRNDGTRVSDPALSDF
jgi:gas vesicle protein